MAEEVTEQREASALGVRHAFLVFTSPSSLFGRVEDTGAYGWSLIVLLTLVALIGYAEVKTGLIDRVVDQRTDEQLAELERTQLHLVDRVELRERMEEIRKGGEFSKLVRRLGAIVLSPAFLLVSALLISSCLYAVVALTGRKPEYHTLLSICVYSAFVHLVACALRLAMMLTYKTIDVDTSLGALATSKQLLWLSGIDPFRIWFWVLVAVGLSVTRQLSRRVAIVSCIVMGLVSMGGHAARAYIPS